MARLENSMLVLILASFCLLAEFSNRAFMVSESQQLLAKRWRNYKEKYDLQLESSEELYRLSIYRKNMEFIHFFNEEGHGFTLAENQFSHWTHEEYMIWLEESNKLKMTPEDIVYLSSNNLKMAITDRDWRAENKVTPVKNQGGCGSCYAFSTTAAVESVIAIATGKLEDLSPQDIIDCTGSYGNKGCSGGYVSRTFKYYMDSGVVPLASYPYKGVAGTCLRPNLTTVTPTKITKYVGLTPNDETLLATTISNLNPVTVSVDASSQTFQFYSTGIYYNPTCSSTAVNHGVTAVGIGSSPSAYYIIKNSWGTTWGSVGYMQLARDQNNNCGVALSPVYPVK